MAKFLGNIKVKINSKLVKTVPGTAEYHKGGFTRASQMADDTFNYNEQPIPSMLSFEGLYTAETDENALNALSGGTVEIISDLPTENLTITNATRMGEPITVSSSTGRFRMQIEGDPIP